MKIPLKSINVPVSVIRADVRNPDKKLIPCYCSNVLMREGTGELIIPTALNDPSGKWTVCLQDVLTGMKTTVSFELKNQEGQQVVCDRPTIDASVGSLVN